MMYLPARSTCVVRPLVTASLVVLLGGSLASAQQLFRVAPGVSAQLARVQFHVRSGRIYALNDTPGGRLNFGAKSLGREETLTVDLSGPYPTIDYTIVSRTSRLSIAISDGDRIRAVCVPQGSRRGASVMFDQHSGRGVSLQIEKDDEHVEHRADSIWHLFVARPEVAREHVAPILQILRPGWPLSEQAREVEQHLYALSRAYEAPNRELLAKLVEQLGDETFGRRQDADRRLREIGTGVVPYLRNLDMRQLDAEQQFRVRRIVTTFADSDREDVPVHVARRLVSDPNIWLALLERESLPEREAARNQLCRLMGEKLQFDPAADAETRDRQLAALRSQIGG